MRKDYEKRLHEIRIEELKKQIRYEKRNKNKWWSSAKEWLPKLEQQLKETKQELKELIK